LVASEAITFADALRLVRERGRLMAEAAAANPGMMVAILGLDGTVVESLCQEAGSLGIVQPANYNCPGQFVISGEEKAVQQAVELAQKAGAKKCVTLKVSGAFHSPLMKPAELGLRKALSNIKLSKPKIPFIANVTGDYVEEPEKIREMLALQLSSPIQWEASVRRMVDDGITTFVEVGPGKVLAGLMRRIYREAKISSTDNLIKEYMDL
jgi:[acyl-carrier-protein] S-malonyltransferase